jgi:hypothetical protein
MKSGNILRLSAAAAIMFLAACSKDSTSPSLIDNATLTTDIASSAGDAIALDVSTLAANEVAASLSQTAASASSIDATAAVTDSIAFSRSRTCFDETGTVIACVPLANVRMIVTHLSFDGTRSGSAANGATFAGTLHRVADDTLTRVFTSGTETSRIHSAVAAGSDTTSFSGPNVTRTHEASGIDSIEAVTFNLPRISNPWPVSGAIVRNVSVHATFTSATRTQTIDVQKRVEVDFPADAQGNVTLKIDNMTCNLNLVTHAVTGCQ